MNIEDFIPQGEQKMRIVQELVPGKQVTLAHVIASPDPIIYRKLGLDPKLDYNRAAIGILSLSPAEISVIAADIAMKKANIDMGFRSFQRHPALYGKGGGGGKRHHRDQSLSQREARLYDL